MKKLSSIQATEELKERLGKVAGKTYEDKIVNLLDKKDDEVKNMVEEAVKKVLIESAERKKYMEEESKAVHAARKAFIKNEVKSPLCRKCFHDDWHAHKVKDWKEYCNSKKVRETEDIERNPKSLMFGQKIGMTYDFICTQKHGTSIQLLNAELGVKSEAKG